MTLNFHQHRELEGARPVRSGVVLLIGLTSFIAGCSSVGLAKVPTCSEYASLSPNTGLMSDLTDDQESALKNMLTKHDRKSSAENVTIAALQVTAYCNIVSGVANDHKDDGIDGIPGLQD